DINWLMTTGREGPPNPVLRINNVYGVMVAVESGLGIAALPDYMVQGNSRIVRILQDSEGPAFDTYFVYPEELRNSKRIAV
ncbi:LysR substrate-binding domain-containing protein, partial [Acinetobacter baumannii]